MLQQRYTLEEFNDIEAEGFDYTLPDDTLALINKLSDMVGAPSYSKTPIFTKKGLPGKRRKRAEEITDEEWEILRNFQTTTIVRKEGIEKKLDEARILFNKITSINYEKMKDKIIEIVREFGEDKEGMNKICNFIFDIASTNKFYSELYAQLYSDLIAEFGILKSIFEDSFSSYLVLFEQIDTCSAEEDYDMFCKINKTNDKRRSMSLFVVNLMKHNIIDISRVMMIVLRLQQDFNKLITEKNQKIKVEEISENIFIIVSNSVNTLRLHSDWNNLYLQMKNISTSKVKDYNSLTNKAIFKYMDIIEKIE